jgi:hypothetical protein
VYEVSDRFTAPNGDRDLLRSPVDRLALPAGEYGYVLGAQPGLPPQQVHGRRPRLGQGARSPRAEEHPRRHARGSGNYFDNALGGGPLFGIMCVCLPSPVFRAHTPRIASSDPRRAFENLVARDVLMAEHIRHDADRLGLPVVSVDADSLLGIAAIIERHLASQLPGVC